MPKAASLAFVLLALAACGQAVAAGPQRQASDDRGEHARERWRQPDALIAAMALPAGARVADVGCGDGYLTVRLAAAVGPGGQVVATDLDGLALLRTAARAARAHTPVEARLVTATETGLEPGRYDVILLTQVDHLLVDRVAFLRALAGALAPGGRLVVQNRAHFGAALRADATRAGLTVRESALELPGQFLVELSRR